MYIRWVVRKHKNASVADMTFHDAYLVESFRDDAGSPRQRTIGYLGNIREIGGSFPTIERELFLLRAERILSSLPEVNGAEREEMMDLLRERIPPLNKVEVERAFQENLRWYQAWWRSNGTTPSRTQLLEMIDAAAGDMGVV